MAELKENITDFTAAALVLSVPIMVMLKIAVSSEYYAFAGFATMYLFGKYTPNSA